MVGRALRDFARRDEVVVATKVWGPVFKGPNGKGLSRKAILSEIDKSLRRLGMDYVDLYIVHRYDYDTPLEETLEALNDVVRAGKARYLGASSMHAWQFMKALGLQRAHGWAPFISMQNYYNLLYREDEREMLRLCASEGIGVTPWSPLARGRLTRPWQPEPTTERAKTDAFAAHALRPHRGHRPARDRPHAWRWPRRAACRPPRWRWRGCCSKPAVTSPVFGATKDRHLDDAVAAVSLKLSPEEIARLEELYQPHAATEGYS